MFFVAEIPRSPTFDFNRPIPIEARDAEYSGRREPSHEGFLTFVFEQTLITLEGGRQTLKLSKPLNLRINPDTMRFTVEDWGIELDCMQLPQVPREVARRFLLLLSAAENESLSDADQAAWLRISDYVDYQQFSSDRSAPRYMEGTLLSNATVVIVEWHDGSHETLDWHVARALSEVNPGERFSAFVKLGKGDKAMAIERVSLLGLPSATEDWESWPKKN
jgi:hypothetical protein